MGRKESAEKTAARYPWVKASDRELPPDLFEDVWSWFLELHITRPRGMGVGSISYQEISAFGTLRGLDLLPDDVRLIRSIDNLYLKAEAEKPSEKPK